jgi:hypothetical protein
VERINVLCRNQGPTGVARIYIKLLLTLLIDRPFIIIGISFYATRPACTNWVQSSFRPTRCNGLQYHTGRDRWPRMVRQIVKPGIRYGTGNSTEWSGITSSAPPLPHLLPLDLQHHLVHQSKSTLLEPFDESEGLQLSNPRY